MQFSGSVTPVGPLCAMVAKTGRKLEKKKSINVTKTARLRGKVETRPQRLPKTSLGSALIAGIKKESGRDDISFEEAPQVATKIMHTVPIEERAGFPVRLEKGCVHPKDWITVHGVKIEIDFSRHW